MASRTTESFKRPGGLSLTRRYRAKAVGSLLSLNIHTRTTVELNSRTYHGEIDGARDSQRLQVRERGAINTLKRTLSKGGYVRKTC